MSDAPFTRQDQATASGDYNSVAFLFLQLLARCSFATLVRVESCTNAGGLSPVGTVDVTPLVNNLDGRGRSSPNAVVYGLPYMRWQGGTSAVILDPVPGDVGLAVFADRDISAVKATGAQANPSSARRNDFADGVYVGAWSKVVPSQFFRFSEDGIEAVTPATFRVQAAAIVLDGPVSTTSTVDAAGEIIAKSGSVNAVSVTGHRHAQGADGHGDAEVPTNSPTPGT